ncbi:TadE/TadG family type IV pilus assembly protein [Photobacterium swingsii]|uniref:TadE/TadG family type IV pilus assembly protein n=1 Tax=Photobacterium swingsii TaxID=680026 RepID=UPI0040694F85
MHSFKRQSGVAAIWFVLIFIALASLTALGVEGARYLNNKARLGDALETASLLLAAQEAKEGDDVKNQALVTKVARSYLPDAESTLPELKIYYKSGEEQVTIDKKEHTVEYLQYKVAASTEHDSWMDMVSVPSFDETQNISNFAAAKKIAIKSGVSDAFLVMDHSLNMNSNTCQIKYPGSNIYKHQTAKLFIAHQLAHEFINRKQGISVDKSKEDVEPIEGNVAVFPFDTRTSNYSNDQSGSRNLPLCQNHLDFYSESEENRINGTGVDKGFGEIDWNHQDIKWLTMGEALNRKDAIGIYVNETYNLQGTMGQWLPDAEKHIDYRDTVNSIARRNSLADTSRESNLMAFPDNRLCRGNFMTVSITNPKFNTEKNKVSGYLGLINSFTSNSPITQSSAHQPGSYIGGWSASYQGILQALNDYHHHGDKEKQSTMVVILGGGDRPNLSDDVRYKNGEVIDHSNILQKLSEHGLCEKIKNDYPKLNLFAIGIDVDPKRLKGVTKSMGGCIDDANTSMIDHKAATGTTGSTDICWGGTSPVGTDFSLTGYGISTISAIVSAGLNAGGAAGKKEEIGSIHDRRAK